ncbi:MAG: hypothetical protein Q8Q36_03000 [bacterium]|nr:hypothetical protein [bacterium]
MDKLLFCAVTEHSVYRVTEKGAKKIWGDPSRTTNIAVNHILEHPQFIGSCLAASFDGEPSKADATSPITALFEDEKKAIEYAETRGKKPCVEEETARVREKFKDYPLFARFIKPATPPA